MARVKRGDFVRVIAGREVGKSGKVIRVVSGKIVVEGVNIAKKHQRFAGEGKPHGIVDKELPLHVCKVMLVCPKCNEPTRVGYRLPDEEGGKKTRFCKKCDEVID